jgi:hypothetical protein
MSAAVISFPPKRTNQLLFRYPKPLTMRREYGPFVPSHAQWEEMKAKLKEEGWGPGAIVMEKPSYHANTTSPYLWKIVVAWHNTPNEDGRILEYKGPGHTFEVKSPEELILINKSILS